MAPATSPEFQSSIRLTSLGNAQFGGLNFRIPQFQIRRAGLISCVSVATNRTRSIIFAFQWACLLRASIISGIARIRRYSPCFYLRSRKHSFEKCAVREVSSFGDSNTAAVGHNKTLQPQSAANQRMHPTSATTGSRSYPINSHYV